MSKRNPRRRAGRDALWRRVKSLGRPCWICGLPIDPSVPAGHPLSFELDELVPVSKGGSPTDMRNTAGSHRVCNQWRSNRSVASVNEIRAEVIRRFGRWSTPQQFAEMARSVAKGGRSALTPIRHPKKRSGI